VVIIILLLRILPDSTSNVDSNMDVSPTMAGAIKTDSIVNNSQVAPLQLLAICSGRSASIEVEACRKSFAEADKSLSLGENIVFIPSESVSGVDLEFSIDNSPNVVPFSEIDSVISNLETKSMHSVRIRRQGQAWSNEINFRLSLQEPGQAMILGLCADLLCAPDNSLIVPMKPGENAFYPLAENVFGLTKPPTMHMWIELMLDGDDSVFGCVNCAAAKAAQFTYPVRTEFGTTGIFYNWDIKNLTSGRHSLQARLRNKLFAGPWSDEFIFEVQRP
jgi:hypothetical protein